MDTTVKGVVMYGHHRNTGIRRITRYEEALKRLNDTKPIAGNGVNAGVKPLGHRNKPQYQIRMRQDESIACRLWRTDVVVFDKDGTITIDPAGYSTISTANFIGEVLGVRAGQYDNRLIVSIGGSDYQADGLKLRCVDAWDHRYEVIESKQEVIHNLDRKQMNALRKDTKEFRKFLAGLMKIKDYTLTEEEIVEINTREVGKVGLSAWREDTASIVRRNTEFVELIKSGDAENWHRASMWLCSSARYSSWDKKFDPRRVITLLDDVLIALNPTVLVPIVLEAGVIRRDSYSRFKPFLQEYWK